jgi:hypothetical protein
MGHADQQDDLRIDETDEAEADRLAQDAERLDDQIETLTRGTTPPSERTFDEQWAGQLRTSASPLDLAEAEQAMLWSDDPVLRSLARGTGVRVTSTQAVLHRLLSASAITAEQHEACLRSLIKARIGNVALNEQRLFELAEDDNWHPASVAAALARLVTWADPLDHGLLSTHRCASTHPCTHRTQSLALRGRARRGHSSGQARTRCRYRCCSGHHHHRGHHSLKRTGRRPVRRHPPGPDRPADRCPSPTARVTLGARNIRGASRNEIARIMPSQTKVAATPKAAVFEPTTRVYPKRSCIKGSVAENRSVSGRRVAGREKPATAVARCCSGRAGIAGSGAARLPIAGRHAARRHRRRRQSRDRRPAGRAAMGPRDNPAGRGDTGCGDAAAGPGTG